MVITFFLSCKSECMCTVFFYPAGVRVARQVCINEQLDVYYGRKLFHTVASILVYLSVGGSQCLRSSESLLSGIKSSSSSPCSLPKAEAPWPKGRLLSDPAGSISKYYPSSGPSCAAVFVYQNAKN